MFVIDAPDDPTPYRDAVRPTPTLDAPNAQPDTDPAQPTSGPLDETAETARERARRIAARSDRNTLAALHHAQREALIQAHRAETKAAALVAVFAAALAAALVLAHTSHTEPAGWLARAATPPLLGALAALLSVLGARLNGQIAGVRRWALFRDQPAALAADVDLPLRRQIRAQADRLADLSATAVARARRINAAIGLLLAGLMLLSLAVLTA